MVEKEQLSSAVYYSQEVRPNAVVAFSLSGVETARLQAVEARFFEILQSVKVDMTYMTTCIDREKRQQKFYAETQPSFFASAIISDFLFGKRDGSTLRRVCQLSEFEELKTWSRVEWEEFLNKWIANAPHVSILGRPSAQLSKMIKQNEEARITTQQKELGQAGLQQLAEKLESAKAQNSKEIPKHLLDSFQTPDTSSIHFIHTTTARSGAALDLGRPMNKIQSIVDQDRSEAALFIQFEHVSSNFVHIHLILGTERVPIHLRPLLAVYVENFFTFPLIREGRRMEFEEVVMKLEEDTVEYQMGTGSTLSNPEVLHILFEVEADKYQAAIGWLRDLLWNSVFEISVGSLI